MASLLIIIVALPVIAPGSQRGPRCRRPAAPLPPGAGRPRRPPLPHHQVPHHGPLTWKRACGTTRRSMPSTSPPATNCRSGATPASPRWAASSAHQHRRAAAGVQRYRRDHEPRRPPSRWSRPSSSVRLAVRHRVVGPARHDRAVAGQRSQRHHLRRGVELDAALRRRAGHLRNDAGIILRTVPAPRAPSGCSLACLTGGAADRSTR